MNKFIKNIIHFSLRHRSLVFFFTGILVVLGVISYKNTPIETFPDVTNTQVVIIAQWAGRSAEEVEKFITLPLTAVTLKPSLAKMATLKHPTPPLAPVTKTLPCSGRTPQAMRRSTELAAVKPPVP